MKLLIKKKQKKVACDGCRSKFEWKQLIKVKMSFMEYKYFCEDCIEVTKLKSKEDGEKLSFLQRFK
jgi:hypothetical protein